MSLGYTWYGTEFQRTGLNRNCKYLLLYYAFDMLGVDRVEFRADLRNVKSIQAMKQIGCTQEGILRKKRQHCFEYFETRMGSKSENTFTV